MNPHDHEDARTTTSVAPSLLLNSLTSGAYLYSASLEHWRGYAYACVMLCADRLASLDWPACLRVPANAKPIGLSTRRLSREVTRRASREANDDFSDQQLDTHRVELSAGHPLADVWQYPSDPNRDPDCSLYITKTHLLNLVVMHLMMSGSAYLQKVRGPLGEVVGLLPLPPQWVRIWVVGGRIAGYRTGRAAQIVLPPQDVVHIRVPSLGTQSDPSGLVDGQAPILAAFDACDIDLLQSVYDRRHLRNFGRAPYAITSGERDFSEDQIALLRQQMAEKARDPDEVDKPLVLPAGAGIVELPQEETQNGQSSSGSEVGRDLVVQRICAVLRVPFHMLSHNQAVSGGVAEAGEARFDEHTIYPMAMRIRDALNQQLVEAEWPGQGLEIDFGERRANPVRRRSEARSDWEAGLITRNEARELMGYEATPDGDVFAEAGASPGADGGDAKPSEGGEANG